MEAEKKKKKYQPKTISLALLLILGIIVILIGTVLLLKGNNKANSTGFEKIVNNMKELNSYYVEFKITNDSTYTNEYFLNVDNEHQVIKYQFINRELVSTNYVAYQDFANGKEYYLNEFENTTVPLVAERVAKVSDLFDRLLAGKLSSYSNGVYTITLSKEEVNKYNANYETLLYGLAVLNESTDVTDNDVDYHVSIENNRVKKIEVKIGAYSLTYNFSKYNEASVTLPKTDSEGNVIDKFVDEFRNNNQDLIVDEPYEEEAEVIE